MNSNVLKTQKTQDYELFVKRMYNYEEDIIYILY